MHTTHLLTLLASTLFALSAASPTTMHTRAEKAAVAVCENILASTPMCCNEDADGEDGLDCTEATKIKTVKTFKKGCKKNKKKQANCCAAAFGGALICQKVV